MSSTNRTYSARQTLQITEQGDATSTLVVHEDRGDGTPVCGMPNRDWRGKPMVYTRQGPGQVTCGSCAHIAGMRTR